MRRRNRILQIVAMLAFGAANAHTQGAGAPAPAQVEQWFREYMTAINSHNVESVMSYYAPDMVRRRAGQQIPYVPADMRAMREWEAPMKAHFEYEIISVRDGVLTARQFERNLLYTALDTRRPLVSQSRWRDGKIVELHLKEIREEGRSWREALAELEAWLAAKPGAQTAGVLRDGRLVEHVPLPDPFVTNLCFAGPDRRTAYITLSGKGQLVKVRWPRAGLALNFLTYR